jgi:hypothetical protein
MGGSRGKKKPKITDLSRTEPTKEEFAEIFSAITKDINTVNPIVAAILGVACVEYELEKLLRSRFSRKDDETWALLTSDIGPLGTFSSKITAGYAFKIYDKNVVEVLNSVRRIRNQFAHAKRLIKFDNELIVNELRSACKFLKKSTRDDLLEALKSKETMAKSVYISLCLYLMTILLRKRNEVHSRAIRHYKKKEIIRALKSDNPFYSSLVPYAYPLPQATSKLNPLATPAQQSADPKSPTPLGSPSVLLRSIAKNDDSEGK